MSKIYKYQLEIGTTVVSMPEDARVITAQVQRGNLCMWVVVDPNAEVIDRHFAVVGTGHHVPDSAKYIATFQLDNGGFVGHVFEVQPYKIPDNPDDPNNAYHLHD